MSDIFDYQLRLAKAGFKTIPIDRQEKIPLTGHGSINRTKDLDTIEQWQDYYGDYNIAICAGKDGDQGYGLVIIDCDHTEGQMALLDYMKSHGSIQGLIDKVPAETTPSGGCHLYFTTNEIYHNSTRILTSVDVRGQGGYCVCAPSQKADGRAYKWLPGRDILSTDADLLFFPEIQDLLLPYIDDGHGHAIGAANADRIRNGETTLAEIRATERRLGNHQERTGGGIFIVGNRFQIPEEGVSEGGRNEFIFKLARSLWSRNFDEEELEAICEMVNDQYCIPSIDDVEMAKTIHAAISTVPQGH